MKTQNQAHVQNPRDLKQEIKTTHIYVAMKRYYLYNLSHLNKSKCTQPQVYAYTVIFNLKYSKLRM